MQGVYNVLTTIKNQLQKDKFVNTVTTGDIFSVDLAKQTIFPLSHIIMNNATWESNVWRFNISVMCMDIIDISKDAPLPFVGNSNEQDILNTQHSVVSDLITILNGGNLNDNLFQLDGEPNAEPFFDYGVNKLAGWTVSFDVLIPNDSTNCEDGYLPTIVCANGTVNILNSNSDLIKSVSIPSGATVSTQINDTAIKVRNTDGEIVATGISLGGAVSTDVELPDTDYQIEVDGILKDSFNLSTLSSNDITIELI